MKLIYLLLITFTFVNADIKECFQVEDKKEFIGCLEREVKASNTTDDRNFLASIYVNEKIYDKAIPLYEESASHCDEKAMYYLGGIYNEGLKEYDKALYWFERSYEYNYKDSSAFVAQMIEKKFNKDDKAIRAYLQKRIDNKDKKGYEFLGAYEFRLKNYKKAIESFKKAVELHNSSQAMYGIGSVYRGHLKDDKKATVWFKKASKLEHPKATYSIGYIYKENKEYKQAIEWFKKSRSLGVEESSYAIANAYTGMKDYDKAKEQYLKMVKEGNIKGYKEIAIMYSFYLKDESEAIKWYKKGIEAGDATAAATLGYLYKKRKDYKNLLKYNKVAYKMGYSGGANAIAYYYLRTEKDEEKAIVWYKKANRLGDARGLKFLKKTGVKYE